MTDLLGAMAMEKEYRKLQTDWEAKTAFGYHEKLQAFGFADTVEYEQAKAEYYFDNTNYDIKYVKNTEEELAYLFAVENKLPTVIFSTADDDSVHIGTDSKYNKSYCDKNNIFVVRQKRSGGAIVLSNNDLIVIYYNPLSILATDIFREKIIEMIKSLKEGVAVEKNDILIDGYKVAGFGFDSGIGSIGLILSFSVNTELIKNACTKNTDKPVKGLGDFVGITRQDVIDEICSWLQ